MAALADLQNSPVLLSALMDSDPRLALVNAIAWLDPATLTQGAADPRYIEFDYDAEEPLTIGLHVCRECFPIVYAGAIQLQWQGADERTIERFILEGMGAYLVVPPQVLEELRYGPSVDFCGLYLNTLEPEDADNPPFDQLLPLFGLFGLTAGGDEPDEVQSTVFIVAKVLVQSLTTRRESVYIDLANLLTWMFSFSGNTAIDYTEEAFWENGYDTAEWTLSDVALIDDINREAHEHVTSAFRAMNALESDLDLRRAFTRNIKAVTNAIHKYQQQKGTDNARPHRQRGDPDAAPFTRYARWPERP